MSDAAYRYNRNAVESDLLKETLYTPRATKTPPKHDTNLTSHQRRVALLILDGGLVASSKIRGMAAMPRVTSVDFHENFRKRHLYLEGSSKTFENHSKSIENMRHERGTLNRGTVVATGQNYNFANPIGRINVDNPSTVIRADTDERLRAFENAIIAEMDVTSSRMYLADGHVVHFSLNLPDHQNVHYNYYEGKKFQKYKSVPVYDSTHVRIGGRLNSIGNGELNLSVFHLESTSESHEYEPAQRMDGN